MRKLLRVVLLCTLSFSACSDDDSSDPKGDGGDSPRVDAAVRDASVNIDANTPRDSGRTDSSVTPGEDGGTPVDDAGNQLDAATPDSGGTPLVTFVYIGGHGNAYPVRTYTLDRSTGALTLKGEPQTTFGDSPTFITPSADKRFLYIADEDYNNGGVTVASVSATGVLAKLELEPAVGGGGLVYTTVDPSGKYVLATSYKNGYVVVYPIKATDGTLDAQVYTKDFDEGSISANAHSVRVHPNGNFVYVPTLGLNKVQQFSLDKSTGKLAALTPPAVTSAGGPRHFAFNKSGKYAFLITEKSTELVAYRVDENNGTLTEIDRKSALPSGQSGDKGAHVLVHPNDKFVYTSNRTDNSIAVFSIANDGKVTQIQTIKTTGPTPRNFDIDSEGKYLVVANQGTDDSASVGSIAVFEIGGDGKLTLKGTPLTGIKSPQAVSIVTK